MTHFELTPGWGMALGLLLVALNGFFVAAEFALVKVRPTQLEPHIADGSRRARLSCLQRVAVRSSCSGFPEWLCFH